MNNIYAKIKWKDVLDVLSYIKIFVDSVIFDTLNSNQKYGLKCALISARTIIETANL